LTDAADPVNLIRRAFDQSIRLVDAVPDDRFGDPTPCADFDVRALVGHMTFAAGRLAAAGRRQPIIDEPPVITGVADSEWSAAFGSAAKSAIDVWTTDGALEGEITLPYGTFAAPVVVLIYVEEQVTHGWDLAVAIGREATLDPVLAEVMLPVVQQFIPVDGREEGMGFAAAVDVPDSAPVYDRLAAYLGRQPGPR
jgi:uncharacterized protein (TIGR03086 family)